LVTIEYFGKTADRIEMPLGWWGGWALGMMHYMAVYIPHGEGNFFWMGENVAAQYNI